MPFEVLPIVAKPLKDVRASISYRKSDTKHGRSKNPKLIVGIPKAISGDFKPKATQLFNMLIGHGADAGKARILPATDGVKPTLLKGGAIFRFGFVPMLGQDAAEKDFVAVKTHGAGFELELPAWFKSDAVK